MSTDVVLYRPTEFRAVSEERFELRNGKGEMLIPAPWKSLSAVQDYGTFLMSQGKCFRFEISPVSVTRYRFTV